MANVKFVVRCIATYESSMEIPDELKGNKRAVINFIRENLSDCDIESPLKFSADLDDESQSVPYSATVKF